MECQDSSRLPCLHSNYDSNRIVYGSFVYSHQILKALKRALPGDGLISEPSAVRPFETDALTFHHRKPWVVALPTNVNEVRSVLEICFQAGIPVVTRGAGTGLSGGAQPLENAVLLSLTRMNRILEIDPVACTSTVEPGVTNLAISDAAAPFGLYYAPDPSSQIACTIGGNVAENSGGVHCLKYGLTVHNVLGLKALTIQGDELVAGGKVLEIDGLDYLAILSGSEGMLAVITEVTVKLLHRPQAKRVYLAVFDSVSEAGDAVADIIGAGIIPAGLEMMDGLAIQAVEEFVHAGYPLNAEAMLLCEVDGSPSQIEMEATETIRVFKANGATEIREANSERECAELWRGRKAALPAAGRLAPDCYCMDGTIPRHEISNVLARIAKLGEEAGLAVMNVFHAGDGNLHPLIMFDGSRPGELERAKELGGRILEECVRVGGTITGEHGVGIEKLDQMCIQFTNEELDQFHRLKAAFDPVGLLNPGKAIPTLARCSELGGMHVRHGQLPHPELERF